LAGAFSGAEDAIGRHFPGSVLQSTPATTGRVLWLKSIPAGTEWEPLPADVQELIRSTSGQARREVRRVGGTIDGLVCLDGRFMYAACVWGLGAGLVAHDDQQLTAADFVRGGCHRQVRGRYRVRFAVPGDWRHVGLL